jgi:hypothetical protein
MPRTRREVEHLRAGVCVHGEVGQRVGHGVMRARGGSSGARQVGPLAVAPASRGGGAGHSWEVGTHGAGEG